MDETRRVLVLPDTHIPNHDRKSLSAVFDYAGSQEWDEVIHLGDLMDLDLISSYNKGQLRKVEGQRLMKDFAAGNEFLDELEAATPGAKKVIIEGNHDERMERYLNVNPELEGVLEVKNQLRLDDRGIQWVRFASKGEMYKIGKATFIHGIYVGPHHAAKHVEAYEKNVFYGNSHDFQSHSKRSIGDNDVKIGQSLGCLCKYKPYYLKGWPDKWQQGFAVFHFLPNGYFNYYPVSIFNNKFVSPEGHVWK